MKKGFAFILSVIMLLTASNSIFANGGFTSWSTSSGEVSPGVYQANIAWTDLGSGVDHYEVGRVPVMYPWGGSGVAGCSQLTTTSCTDPGDIGTYLRYYVKAYMKDGSVSSAAPLDVNLSGYSGAPAVSNVTIENLENRTYKVGFAIQSGNNADVWELYQNGSLINFYQGILSENGTNAQAASKTVTLAPGTYQFKVKLSNGFGSTETATQTLVVQ